MLEGAEVLDAQTIGGRELVAMVIMNDYFPDMWGSYNHSLSEVCPRCGYDNTCCIDPGQELHGWYCKDCLTMWEWHEVSN